MSNNSQSKNVNTPKNGRYITPTPGEMPIIANGLHWEKMYSTNPPNKSEEYIFQRTVTLALECGFNIGTVGSSIDAMAQYFRCMGDYFSTDQESTAFGKKLAYFVGSAAIFPFDEKEDVQTGKSKFLKFINHPYIVGHIRKEGNENGSIRCWSIIDEPKQDQLDRSKEYLDYVEENTPSVNPIINLIGDINISSTYFNPSKKSESVINGSEDKPKTKFQNYLEYLYSELNPIVWCYDLYPIRSKYQKLYTEYKAFYYDLEVMRHISYISKEPFWAHCQSMAFEDVRNSVIRPVATVATLRLEAFSALAYGAKGILYWTFMLRNPSVGVNSLSEYYSSALVAPMLNENKLDSSQKYDLFKFPSWYAAKQVNSEIHKYEKIFLNTEAYQVRHTGTTPEIEAIFKANDSGETDSPGIIVCRRLEGGIGPFTRIESCPIGILISVLVPSTSKLKKNSRYIIIINHDPFCSQIVIMFSRRETVITELADSDNALVADMEYTHRPSETSMPRVYTGNVPEGQKADCRVLLPGSYMVFEYESTDRSHDYD